MSTSISVRKIGHCCLLIKTGGVTILTDPGAFSDGQDSISGIDAVIITHEHADHLHIPSLKAVIANNPAVRVIANIAVGVKLGEQGIVHEVIKDGEAVAIGGVPVTARDCRHEEIFEEFGIVQNTGFLIAERLWYPGDSFTVPGGPVDILALPVAGPWCRIRDAVSFAFSVKPRVAFPVHDGMLRPERIGASHAVPEKVLAEHGIRFVPLREGEEADF